MSIYKDIDKHIIVVRYEDKNIPLWVSENKHKKMIENQDKERVLKLTKRETENSKKLFEEITANEDKEEVGGWVSALIPLLTTLLPPAIELGAKYIPKLIEKIGSGIEKFKVRVSGMRETNRIGEVEVPVFTVTLKEVSKSRKNKGLDPEPTLTDVQNITNGLKKILR